MTLTKLSLFSGIGGDDLASEWAGFKTIAFCEKDKFCQKVLNKHWPEIPIIEDVKDVKGEIFKGVDLISGGFPCQPFSCAGKRRGKEDDRYLWPEMLRIISEVKPKWIVGENVAGIISMAIKDVLSDLESCDYQPQVFLIPACAVGAWHRRDRAFIVAHSKSIHGELCNKEIRESKGLGEFGRYIEGYANTRSIRTIHGIPTKMDSNRLKSLGNAVVPQQIYPIYKAIAEIETNR